MQREQIRDEIQSLLRDIVGEDGLMLTYATQAAEVTWWDSLTHLKLLVGIEEAWGLSFQVDEISAPQNVGELVDMIQGKLPA